MLTQLQGKKGKLAEMDHAFALAKEATEAFSRAVSNWATCTNAEVRPLLKMMVDSAKEQLDAANLYQRTLMATATAAAAAAAAASSPAAAMAGSAASSALSGPSSRGPSPTQPSAPMQPGSAAGDSSDFPQYPAT